MIDILLNWVIADVNLAGAAVKRTSVWNVFQFDESILVKVSATTHKDDIRRYMIPLLRMYLTTSADPKAIAILGQFIPAWSVW